MERVAILGAAGAGKSVLAERLAQRTGLPVVHLDPLFWREGWTPTPRGEALRALAAAVRADRWIVDGNFLEALDRLAQRGVDVRRLRSPAEVQRFLDAL